MNRGFIVGEMLATWFSVRPPGGGCKREVRWKWGMVWERGRENHPSPTRRAGQEADVAAGKVEGGYLIGVLALYLEPEISDDKAERS